MICCTHPYKIADSEKKALAFNKDKIAESVINFGTAFTSAYQALALDITALSSLENNQQKRQECFNKIENFKKLKKGWDGYSADKIELSVIKNSKRILESLNINFFPEVFPTGNSTIQIEFEKADESYLEIEILDDHIEVYTEIYSVYNEYKFSLSEDINKIINDFYS